MVIAVVVVEQTALMLDSKQAAVGLQVITVVVAGTVLFSAQLVALQMVQPLVAVLAFLEMVATLMEPMLVLVVLVAVLVEAVQVQAQAVLAAAAQFLFTTKEKYKCLILQ
jgi:hypothetical protein